MNIKFVLSTDTACDVPRVELDKLNIPYIPLTFTINGEVFEDNFSLDEQYKGFYEKVRSGAMPITSQISSFLHEEYFEKLIANGAKDIIHFTLSSGLSATYSSACTAAEAIMEKHDGVKIYIVDSLAATQAANYIFAELISYRDSGETAKDAVNKIEDTVSRLQVFVIADDLMHLRRGGRVSGASAYIGTLLKIKPVIVINHEGKLIPYHKAKGTKNAVSYVIKMMRELGEDIKNQTVYIAHADNIALAEEAEKEIKEAFECGDCHIGWIGPVIGAHTGSGTLGIVFKGKKRLTVC